MNHYEISFSTTDETLRDVLVARLSEAGYEAFEEQETQLLAFIPDDTFDETILKELSEELNIGYTQQSIAQQNWNAIWEKDFQPVIVPGFCTIRASFHNLNVDTPYEIIITPKMSFGTGHHATTRSVVDMMQELNFKNKKVLDFGTGTGILAILADKLGAASVLGIDNDEWSVTNALENKLLNGSNHISIQQGSLEIVNDDGYDLILANINRHILLQYMEKMSNKLKAGGSLLLSGILTVDFEMITKSAVNAQLTLQQQTKDNNWLALLFNKLDA